MELKPVKRSDLNAKIQTALENEVLVLNDFFLTALRATANNTLQAEFAQLRMLEGQSISLVAALNEGDDRFSGNGTLLYTWLKVEPKALLKRFPNLKFTQSDLEAIAKSYKEDDPKGPDAPVYPVLQTFNEMKVSGIGNVTPIISVTEVTESQIEKGEFFTERSKRQEENIKGALEEEYRIMRTGDKSEEGSEYLVHSATGDRIFRYTRLEQAGSAAAKDVILPKMPQSMYKSTGGDVVEAGEPKAKGAEAILGGDSI